MAKILARLTAWALQLKIVRTLLLYTERRGPMLADSVTYRALFSIFAGVLLGFSIAAIWLAGNPTAWQALIDAVNSAIPGLVGEDGIIETSAIEAPAGVTVAGVIALVGLVGAAIGAMGSMRAAIRTLGMQLSADVAFYWVLLRNLGLAIAIGVSLVASAALTFLGSAGVGILTDWLGVKSTGPIAAVLTTGISVLVVFVLDMVIVAVLFRALSGLRPSARSLWTGAFLGAIGLTVLQQLSGLFVGGASRNPLLASFATLVALLLWVNFSSQVILIASSYIIVGVEEEQDRVRARFGASTFAQRRVKRAEASVQAAADELREARDAETAEREKMLAAAATGGSDA